MLKIYEHIKIWTKHNININVFRLYYYNNHNCHLHNARGPANIFVL